MVGLSSNLDRPSYVVSSYLKENGYQIVPVNPNEKEILGEVCHPNLSSIPVKIEVLSSPSVSLNCNLAMRNGISILSRKYSISWASSLHIFLSMLMKPG